MELKLIDDKNTKPKPKSIKRRGKDKIIRYYSSLLKVKTKLHLHATIKAVVLSIVRGNNSSNGNSFQHKKQNLNEQQ